MPEERSLDDILPQVPAEKQTSAFIDIQTLEDRWQEAQEYVALLTIKLNALQQEYYSMDDMTPRSHIQQQISDTYLKLQKAQQDSEQAKKDLDEAREKIKKRDYRK